MIPFETLYSRIGETPEPSAGKPKAVRASVDRPHRGAKNTAAYNVHSYPTKVPPEAIEPFIEHHTKPGALVLDPFCGLGDVRARRPSPWAGSRPQRSFLRSDTPGLEHGHAV